MPQKRLVFLDNIRIALTVLVILHHIAIGYGAEGLHPWKDPRPDWLSPFLLSFFVAVNQSFFMSAFFFLSGYFTPRSVESRGVAAFLRDRFIRLGIPIVFYSCVLLQVNEYLIDVWWHQETFTSKWGWNVGHLWFLWLLLLFSAVYALSYRLWQRWGRISGVGCPGRRELWISIAVLAALTFVVRIWFPIGNTILGIQPAHIVHYVVAFSAGTLAYRNNWLEHLSVMAGRYWGRVAVATIPLLGIIALAAGVLNAPEAMGVLLGGASVFAFGLAAWDSILMISITCWMLCTFNAKYNQTNSVLKWLSANAYTVYIIHQTVLIALHILADDLSLPSTLKFFIVAGIAIPSCFGISDVIRRVPGTRRVLG